MKLFVVSGVWADGEEFSMTVQAETAVGAIYDVYELAYSVNATGDPLPELVDLVAEEV